MARESAALTGLSLPPVNGCLSQSAVFPPCRPSLYTSSHSGLVPKLSKGRVFKEKKEKAKVIVKVIYWV